MKNVIITAVILLALTAQQLYCQLSVELKPNAVGSYETVNAEAIPLLTAKIRVAYQGQYVGLQPENILILENNRISKPYQISADADNWNLVKWYTSAPGPVMPNYVTFFINYANNNGGITGLYLRQDMPLLSFRNDNYEVIDNISWGILAPGEKKYKRFILLSPMAKKDTVKGIYEEMPIRIDSVRTHTQEFSWYWHGSMFNTEKPPTDIRSPFAYNVSGIFMPQDTIYYRDRMTVYYEGGAKKDIDLIGNKYHLETNTVLKLEYPLGGEIMAPCEEIDIRWSGHAGEFPTIVEYTSNEGSSWNIIGASNDSTLRWRIPKDLTGDVLFRVRQKDTMPAFHNLIVDNTPVLRISFRNDGEKMLSANASGRIYEWNIENKTASQAYLIGDYKYPADVIIITGLDYIETYDMFAVSYYKNTGNQANRRDSIAFFEIGEYSQPKFKIAAGQGYFIGNMYVEPNRRFIVVQPSFGSQLLLLDPENGNFLRTVNFEHIITSISFSKKIDKMVASLLNGKVHILSMPDFELEKSIDFSYLPVISELALSPNGRYLALGIMAPQSTPITGASTQIHVVDLKIDMIVRTNGRISSQPIGLEFNAESSILVIGAQAVPQISKWYLETDYVETSGGNAGELTDFAFSPDGHSLATSSASADNLKLRTMVFEEIDQTDDFVHIVEAFPKLDSLNAGELYIGETKSYITDTAFCNKGIVPIYIFNAYMKRGRYFQLKDFSIPDTVFPGQCVPIRVDFNPLDTGLITDSLVIVTCSRSYEIKVWGNSKNRNISFFSNVFDFGEQCLNDTTIKEFLFIKNEDPVPLLVNSIPIFGQNYNSFEIVNPIRDQILAPGETITLKSRFIPRQLSENLAEIGVMHSGQQKFIPKAGLKGVGIGTYLGISHPRLMFIPEIRQRTFKVENKSLNKITIENIIVKPVDVFRLLSTLPIDIERNNSTEITIEWFGNEFRDGEILIEASPCASASNMTIGLYSGTSALTITDVEADPRENAIIPIKFKNTENRPYQGKRFLEAEITINPRMFYPMEVKSPYGEGLLTRNEVIDGLRVIGFRVEGDYPIEGTAVEILGIAGLAETDFSPINFLENKQFWGSQVQTVLFPGTFSLINLCGERRILHPSNNVEIISMKPNPVSDFCEIEFEVSREASVVIEIFDNLGNKMQSTSNISAREGTNTFSIPVHSLSPGTYRALVRMGADFAAQLFVVIR